MIVLQRAPPLKFFHDCFPVVRQIYHLGFFYVNFIWGSSWNSTWNFSWFFQRFSLEHLKGFLHGYLLIFFPEIPLVIFRNSSNFTTRTFSLVSLRLLFLLCLQLPQDSTQSFSIDFTWTSPWWFTRDSTSSFCRESFYRFSRDSSMLSAIFRLFWFSFLK